MPMKKWPCTLLKMIEDPMESGNIERVNSDLLNQDLVILYNEQLYYRGANSIASTPEVAAIYTSESNQAQIISLTEFITTNNENPRLATEEELILISKLTQDSRPNYLLDNELLASWQKVLESIKALENNCFLYICASEYFFNVLGELLKRENGVDITTAEINACLEQLSRVHPLIMSQAQGEKMMEVFYSFNGYQDTLDKINKEDRSAIQTEHLDNLNISIEGEEHPLQKRSSQIGAITRVLPKISQTSLQEKFDAHIEVPPDFKITEVYLANPPAAPDQNNPVELLEKHKHALNELLEELREPWNQLADSVHTLEENYFSYLVAFGNFNKIFKKIKQISPANIDTFLTQLSTDKPLIVTQAQGEKMKGIHLSFVNYIDDISDPINRQRSIIKSNHYLGSKKTSSRTLSTIQKSLLEIPATETKIIGYAQTETAQDLISSDIIGTADFKIAEVYLEYPELFQIEPPENYNLFLDAQTLDTFSFLSTKMLPKYIADNQHNANQPITILVKKILEQITSQWSKKTGPEQSELTNLLNAVYKATMPQPEAEALPTLSTKRKTTVKNKSLNALILELIDQIKYQKAVNQLKKPEFLTHDAKGELVGKIISESNRLEKSATPSERRDLTTLLHLTHGAHTNKEQLIKLQEHGNKIGKNSGRKFLAGLALSLAALLIIGACIGLAVVSFGGAAPLAAIGICLGAKAVGMIASGAAVGTALVSASSYPFFKKEYGKMQLENASNALVNELTEEREAYRPGGEA